MERLTGHAELQELLGAYALDAVEPEEAEVLERHLQVCPRCREELAQHREVAALLGNAGSAAPDGVWDRIIASLEETPPALQLSRLTTPRPQSRDWSIPGQTGPGVLWRQQPVTPQAPAGSDATVVPIGRPGNATSGGRRGSRGRRTIEMRFLAAVAAAALVVAGLGVAVGRLGRHNSGPSQLALPAAIWNAASAEPNARKLTLTSSDHAYKVDAVMTSAGTTVLGPGNLPSLPANETYQVWGIVDGQRVSLGVIGTDATYATFTTPPKASVLAMTVEPQGGVVTSTKAPVLTALVPT